MKRLSIVIPNYNYADFVGAAVESALAVNWPNVDVIVVDDGSTDSSLDVLDRFGSRITVISQENAGPREACNRGFARSSGDVVIFLDSDDMLEPSIADEVAKVWRPGISKVQVQMRRIDRAGTMMGSVFPTYRFTPTADQIRYWMNKTAAIPHLRVRAKSMHASSWSDCFPSMTAAGMRPTQHAWRLRLTSATS